ncbi:carbohydrate-binding protein [Streptomyces sp. NPDC002540]
MLLPSIARWRPRLLMAASLMLVIPALTTGPAAAAVLPYQDPSQPVSVRVEDLLSRMSLDEKIGQMTQAERKSVTNADITNYRLGSLLSGGGSAPTPNTAINVGDGQTPLFPYGAGDAFPATQNPYNVMGAAYYDDQRGTGLERCSDSGCGQDVGWISAGDYLGYSDVDFGTTSPASVKTRLASAPGRAGRSSTTSTPRQAPCWPPYPSATPVAGSPGRAER